MPVIAPYQRQLRHISNSYWRDCRINACGTAGYSQPSQPDGCRKPACVFASPFKPEAGITPFGSVGDSMRLSATSFAGGRTHPANKDAGVMRSHCCDPAQRVFDKTPRA